MLGDIERTPASTRPKYGLEASTNEPIAGNPVKKAGMLALLALASSLLLVIPDNDDETYAVEAAVDQAGELDGSTALPEEAAPAEDAADETEEAAPVREVASDTGVSSEADTARLAVATEAAMAGAERSAGEGSGIVSFANRMGAAGAAAEALGKPTSTTAAPAAPTTARRAPATTAATTSSSSGEETTSSSGGETTTSTTADGSTSAPDSSDTTAPGGTETTQATTEPETTVPETTVPETTVPETTVPETTAAPSGEAGWVDTGNGVAVPPVLLAIRYCESRDNYTAANPSSSARGGYQFLTGSWAGYGHKDRYGVNQAHLATPAQQDEAALITWQRDGTRPWNASKSCWSKRL